jgi:hypothetical protein
MQKKKEWHKRHYEENKEAERARLKASVKRSRERNYSYVNEIKETTPCADCDKHFDAVCMDFDHVRGEKVKDIAKMTNACCTLEAIQEEIDKCDLVCANCHRIRTRDRKLENVVRRSQRGPIPL